MLRSKGCISEGLKVLEQALQDPQISEFLEDHIKVELQNQRLESKAELLKWDEIAKELTETFKNQQLQNIPFQQADKLIRSSLRNDDQWGFLTKRIEYWQHDQISSVYLDKNFNYERAMSFLTALDYDRARFYLDREISELFLQWKNLTKLS